MVRSVWIAITSGFIIGIALFGLGIQSTEGTQYSDEQPSPLNAPAGGFAHPASPTMPSPQSHTYADFPRDPRLNPHLIAGHPTVLCTTDSRIFPHLKDAIASWNRELASLSVGSSDNQEPLRLVTTPTGRMPTTQDACTDTRVEGGVDIVAVVGKCYFDERDPIACFRSGVDAHTRRMRFTTVDLSDDGTNTLASEAHATIVYETDNADNVTTAVLIHELGHALGLRDYEDDDETEGVDEGCMILRNTINTTNQAHADPHRNHYSLMRNHPSAACTTVNRGGIITGRDLRDLRDLYEAYHVGAVTKVGPTGFVSIVDGSVEGTIHW